MNSQMTAILGSLHWIHRRHVLLILFCCLTVYVLLFDDVYSIVIASSSALAKTTNFSYGSTKTPAKPKPLQHQSKQPPPPLTGEITLPEADRQEEDPFGFDDGSIPPDLVPQNEYVAICLAVKDQALDLHEFFTHHYHHVGIRRFYIMDDGSDPPLSSFTYPGVPRSSLTFTYQDRKTRILHMQYRFYTQCLRLYSSRHSWLAFIDADEFLDAPGNETLTEVLQSFDDMSNVGAVGANWRVHTSNGFLTRQESVRQAFTTCIADDVGSKPGGTMNKHIKSIVKTSKGIPRVINPHKFVWKRGPQTVGENGDVITSAAFRHPITRDRIAVHHFLVKSKEEYEEKKLRGTAMSNHKTSAIWKEVENDLPHVNCSEMAHYRP